MRFGKILTVIFILLVFPPLVSGQSAVLTIYDFSTVSSVSGGAAYFGMSVSPDSTYEANAIEANNYGLFGVATANGSGRKYGVQGWGLGDNGWKYGVQGCASGLITKTSPGSNAFLPPLGMTYSAKSAPPPVKLPSAETSPSHVTRKRKLIEVPLTLTS